MGLLVVRNSASIKIHPSFGGVTRVIGGGGGGGARNKAAQETYSRFLQ